MTNLCSMCGTDVVDLRDEPSQREANISGFCQSCQDAYFGMEKVAGKLAVCPSCEGEGKYVNPSIDSQGLSAEDFDQDPDFREDYMSGAYDVRCSECGGKGLVPQCSQEGCEEPAEAKEQDNGFGMGESRGRSSSDHYDTCFEHLQPEEKEDIRDYRDSLAESAAERAFGASKKADLDSMVERFFGLDKPRPAPQKSEPAHNFSLEGPNEMCKNCAGVGHLAMSGPCDACFGTGRVGSPDRTGKTSLPHWMLASQIGFEVDASIKCADCGGGDDVAAFTNEVKLCSPCRAMYEI